MIRLEPVSQSTFRKVVDMRLGEEQNRFVAPNVVSLAQAWLFYKEARPFAVMNGDEVVGFMMLDWDEDERAVGIWRFMIAPEHQRKGFGRAAIQEAIELVRASDEIDMMYLDYVPSNIGARDLYRSMGFKENGDMEDGEIVMTLPLTDNPKVGALIADMDDFDDLIEVVEAQKAVSLPPILSERSKLQKAVEDGQITRLTIMGDTIGLAFEDGIFLLPAEQSRFEEAKQRLKRR